MQTGWFSGRRQQCGSIYSPNKPGEGWCCLSLIYLYDRDINRSAVPIWFLLLWLTDWLAGWCVLYSLDRLCTHYYSRHMSACVYVPARLIVLIGHAMHPASFWLMGFCKGKESQEISHFFLTGRHHVWLPGTITNTTGVGPEGCWPSSGEVTESVRRPDIFNPIHFLFGQWNSSLAWIFSRPDQLGFQHNINN